MNKHHWVVLVSFTEGRATWHGPFARRALAARALCLLGRTHAVCRHECEHCGEDHSTGKEEHYGKLVTTRGMI